jgi:hypothetical protein
MYTMHSPRRVHLTILLKLLLIMLVLDPNAKDGDQQTPQLMLPRQHKQASTTEFIQHYGSRVVQIKSWCNDE